MIYDPYIFDTFVHNNLPSTDALSTFQVRARMRQGWGAGEGTPTSLALRWEAWLHQVDRRSVCVVLCFRHVSVICGVCPLVFSCSANAEATGPLPLHLSCFLVSMLERRTILQQ
jgi:hypothetical protein